MLAGHRLPRFRPGCSVLPMPVRDVISQPRSHAHADQRCSMQAHPGRTRTPSPPPTGGWARRPMMMLLHFFRPLAAMPASATRRAVRDDSTRTATGVLCQESGEAVSAWLSRRRAGPCGAIGGRIRTIACCTGALLVACPGAGQAPRADGQEAQPVRFARGPINPNTR